LHIYTNTNLSVSQAHVGHLPNEGAKQIAPKIPPILNISEGGLTAKTLAEWMEETSSLECSDPRDTVYALLGLASDIQNAELHILPDYTKTLLEIHPLVAKQYALHALKAACVANGLAVEIDRNGSIEKMFYLALGAAVAKGLKSFVVSETQKHLIRRVLVLVNLPNPVLAWYLNFCTKEFAIEIPMSSKKGRGLWDMLAARLPVLERSRASLSAVAFSVDGKLVAFALQDKTIKVLDVASGALLQSLGSHNNYVTDVAFSLDGSMLASASKDKIVRLWNIATRTVLQSGSVAVQEMKLSFSMDGKYLEINQLRFRIESPSPEFFEIGLKLPLSYYLSSSNLPSNVSGEVILFSSLNGVAMEIYGIYVAREAPIPPSTMHEWKNGISEKLLYALRSRYRYRDSGSVVTTLYMAAKTRAQSGILKLRPTILVCCNNPSNKMTIEKTISRQKFLGSFQVIVYVCKISLA
jgi:WD domain, G-beta repeat